MSITTKAGDEGNTKLLSGQTIRKDHPIAETLGTCDDLTCRLGLAKLYNGNFKPAIDRIQHTLLVIMADISAMRESTSELNKEIHFLEMLLEEYGHDIEDLPQDVVIPGENIPSAVLHHSRVTCRKLERRIVSLMDDFAVDLKVLKYINRLSDVIYLMAIKTEEPDNEN